MSISMANTGDEIKDFSNLLIDGFSGKFHTLQLPKSVQKMVMHCLAEHILKYHYDNLLIIRDEKIQGVLFIKPRKWRWNQLSKKLFKELSLKSFIKTILFLGALDHSCKSKEIHIDFIAVSEYCRGKGIGAKLIERLKSQTEPDEYISLFVSVNNAPAKRLYEKQQFRVKKKGTSMAGQYLHGIKQWQLMEWRGSW